jgi:plasmid maintenance system antidote protein VapI
MHSRADNCKCEITAEAALDLAEALGTSPHLWLNLQALVDKVRWEQRSAPGSPQSGPARWESRVGAGAFQVVCR